MSNSTGLSGSATLNNGIPKDKKKNVSGDAIKTSRDKDTSVQDHSGIKKFDFMNYDQGSLEAQYEQLRIAQKDELRKSKSNDKKSMVSSH